MYNLPFIRFAVHLRFVFVNSFFNTPNCDLNSFNVSPSVIQNSTISRVESLLSSPKERRKFIDSFINILAHLSLGKPNIPELIAGNEMSRNFLSEANKRLARIALLKLHVFIPFTHSWSYCMNDCFTWQSTTSRYCHRTDWNKPNFITLFLYYLSSFPYDSSCRLLLHV